ncbi:MAG: 30S ribosomal protein S17 [Candidatus Pacearchaeota archaeon]
MEKKNKQLESNAKKEIVGTMPDDNISTRGRRFEGFVTKKFDKRVVIEFDRVKYIRKYERYARSKTKIHARLPAYLKNEINSGDYIQIMECRPLSKIIHHIVIKKIRDADSNSQKIVREPKLHKQEK